MAYRLLWPIGYFDLYVTWAYRSYLHYGLLWPIGSAESVPGRSGTASPALLLEAGRRPGTSQGGGAIGKINGSAIRSLTVDFL